MVPETCAEDIKTDIHKTLLELHHTAGRMPSPYPSMAAALSPSSAACSLYLAQTPQLIYPGWPPLRQVHRDPGTAGPQTLATGSTENTG